MFTLGPELRNVGITEDSFLFRKQDRGEYPEAYVPDENGIYKAELYSLDYTIALFVYPRIKAFRKSKAGYPARLTSELWDKILGKIERAFALIIQDDYKLRENDEKQIEINEGLNLFSEYFTDLWT